MQPRDLVANRFEIERVAGAGGMGTVYRALDRRTGQPVALKVLQGRQRDDVERFVREASLLAELRHPGIVGFVASGSTPDGEAYLVMDWLEGESPLRDQHDRRGRRHGRGQRRHARGAVHHRQGPARHRRRRHVWEAPRQPQLLRARLSATARRAGRRP